MYDQCVFLAPPNGMLILPLGGVHNRGDGEEEVAMGV